MNSVESQNKILIDDKLLQFLSPNSKTGALLGNRCPKCGESFFPAKYCCRNCSNEDMEKIALGTRGTLYAFTKIRVNLPNAKVAAPFLVGIVELEEGERVSALLADCEIETLHIGDEMELIIDTIYVNEKGNEVLGWKYKPAGTH